MVFALAFLELDEFKDTNDRYGHHMGEGVLQTVAKRLACLERG
ncbi:diguanylate cyclase [Billgrantia pellis]|uniref:Diguanylate cyclase n=1 Tax=Billgrantia pellis TaxID=2606936 RepID=A0A7V7FZM8_9GAMM|nr:diguanylate cyclase [Halomonas pellis]KAA0012247.1 diguanylate cyclase [Halomonas pellis]